MNIFKIPKDNDKFFWTKHAIKKMKFYGLTPRRVFRILNHPERKEKAIVPDCVAVMQSLGTKRKTEIWVMYKHLTINNKQLITYNKQMPVNNKKIKIISVWRYPGVSPKRQILIPEDVWEELNRVI